MFAILFLLSYYIYSILCDIFFDSQNEYTKLGTGEYYNSLNIFYLYLIFRFKYKTKFYKCHILSIFILVLLLLVTYFVKLFVFTKISFDFPEDLICFIPLIIFPLSDSYLNYFLKYIMMHYYFSPYFVCFLMGIIYVFLSLLLLIIFLNIDCGNSIVCRAISEINNISGYGIILYIFKSILYSLSFYLRLLVMNDYTLFHIIVLFIFVMFVSNIANLIIVDFTYIGLIMMIIAFLIEFFFVCVLFEIIELNFCGLNHNLRMNIITRVKMKQN